MVKQNSSSKQPTRLSMTGEEFKQLIEGVNPDGKIDTLPELMKAMKGISDDSTIKDNVEGIYCENDETLYLDGNTPEENNETTEETEV